MDKNNNKQFKFNKNNVNSTSRTEFAEEMNFDSCKKTNKHKNQNSSNQNK